MLHGLHALCKVIVDVSRPELLDFPYPALIEYPQHGPTNELVVVLVPGSLWFR